MGAAPAVALQVGPAQGKEGQAAKKGRRLLWRRSKGVCELLTRTSIRVAKATGLSPLRWVTCAEKEWLVPMDVQQACQI